MKYVQKIGNNELVLKKNTEIDGVYLRLINLIISRGQHINLEIIDENFSETEKYYLTVLADDDDDDSMNPLKNIGRDLYKLMEDRNPSEYKPEIIKDLLLVLLQPLAANEQFTRQAISSSISETLSAICYNSMKNKRFADAVSGILPQFFLEYLNSEKEVSDFDKFLTELSKTNIIKDSSYACFANIIENTQLDKMSFWLEQEIDVLSLNNKGVSFVNSLLAKEDNLSVILLINDTIEKLLNNTTKNSDTKMSITKYYEKMLFILDNTKFMSENLNKSKDLGLNLIKLFSKENIENYKKDYMDMIQDENDKECFKNTMSIFIDKKHDDSNTKSNLYKYSGADHSYLIQRTLMLNEKYIIGVDTDNKTNLTVINLLDFLNYQEEHKEYELSIALIHKAFYNATDEEKNSYNVFVAAHNLVTFISENNYYSEKNSSDLTKTLLNIIINYSEENSQKVNLKVNRSGKQFVSSAIQNYIIDYDISNSDIDQDLNSINKMMDILDEYNTNNKFTSSKYNKIINEHMKRYSKKIDSAYSEAITEKSDNHEKDPKLHMLAVAM